MSSHKQLSNHNAVEQSHNAKSPENGNSVRKGGAPDVSWEDRPGVQVAPWKPIFVLCAIGLGLLVLVAKATRLF
jgi:hypothetical protein